jgi:DNA primase
MPGHERFRGFLSIPYLDRDARPLTMRFRCLTEHEHREHGHGKYTSITGDPVRMFNVGAVHRADDEIHVAEGELDAIILTRIGLPAVAIPGALLWRAHHRRMLAGFSRVWVWGDPDDAGAEFTTKVCRSLRTAKGVRLRTGDVTDTYLTGGADALHALIGKEAST